MEKIASFTINHMTLLPGIYLSRADAFPVAGLPADGTAEAKTAPFPVTTYDIRITRPNFEPVMGTGEIHTMEHLGATYLRSREDVKSRVIYWGPMGCRTGFYLILAGEPDVAGVCSLMRELFDFISAFEGDIPGATPQECGNYSDMDLPAAKKRAAHYAGILEAFSPETQKYDPLS